jgi:hypothetical protein
MTNSQAPAPVRQPHLRFLPSFIADTERNKALYVLKAWLLTLLPSMALAVIAGSLVGNESGPKFDASGPVLLFLLVVFAPVVETLIMVLPLLLLNRLFGPTAAVILNALGWGIAHSMEAPAWGLIIWWPFFVFSTIVLVWRKKSLATGMLLVMCIHAMQNAGPALLMLATGAT